MAGRGGTALLLRGSFWGRKDAWQLGHAGVCWGLGDRPLAAAGGLLGQVAGPSGLGRRPLM